MWPVFEEFLQKNGIPVPKPAQTTENIAGKEKTLKLTGMDRLLGKFWELSQIDNLRSGKFSVRDFIIILR